MQTRAIASGEFKTVSIFPRHEQTRVDFLSGRRGQLILVVTEELNCLRLLDRFPGKAETRMRETNPANNV